MEGFTTADEADSSIFGKALSAALLCTWSEAELGNGVVVITGVNIGAIGTAWRAGIGPEPFAPRELRSRE